MKTIFFNLKYLLVPFFSLITILGLLKGGLYVWTGVLLFVFCTLIDTLTKNIHLKAKFDANGNSYGVKYFQYFIMYLMLAIFILLQVVLAWRIYQYVDQITIQQLNFYSFSYFNGITLNNLIGAIISTGLWAGLGIIYGHELSHNKKEGFFISRLIMSLSGASHFTYAHVYQHHLHLAHQDDPATAPRGRNVYMHTWLSYAGQCKFSYDLEKEKLKRKGKSFFSLENKWILGYLYSLPSIVLFVWTGGIIGLLSIVLVCILSNFLLEALNFMGHYGLVRENGKPIEHRHSWDNDSVFTDWFFIAIGRQCDHHVRGETYFWELDDVKGPNYGIGYFTLFLFTLIPPIFRVYIKKHLDNWDKKYANQKEKEIASTFKSY